MFFCFCHSEEVDCRSISSSLKLTRRWTLDLVMVGGVDVIVACDICRVTSFSMAVRMASADGAEFESRLKLLRLHEGEIFGVACANNIV